MNNSSLTFLGILQYGIEFIIYNKTSYEPIFHWGSFLIILGILAIIPFILIKIKRKHIISLVIIFLVLNTSLAYTVHTWNVNSYWLDNNQTELGKWINDNIEQDQVILIDTRDCEKISKYNLNEMLCSKSNLKSSYIGLWINNPIIIGDPSIEKNADYVITTRAIDKLKLIKKIGNFSLYKL